LAFGDSDSMWEYYYEVSRGELNIQGDVMVPIRWMVTLLTTEVKIWILLKIVLKLRMMT
jgi:hypothetical protein